ncbi:MAG: nitroreductase family protein [Candidatus Bruticola sp.]
MDQLKSFLFTLGLMALMQISCAAEPITAVELPAPEQSGGRPIMDVFKDRHTERRFAINKEVPEQILSNLLWASWGINRSDGKRTAPTARNSRNIDIYVAKADGLWRYDAAANKLILFKSGDARRGRFKSAPFSFYYVAPVAPDPHFSYMHAGSLYQNAGLYCASCGLGNVVVGDPSTLESINRDYKFDKGYEVLVIQSFGWPSTEKTNNSAQNKMSK